MSAESNTPPTDSSAAGEPISPNEEPVPTKTVMAFIPIMLLALLGFVFGGIALISTNSGDGDASGEEAGESASTVALAEFSFTPENVDVGTDGVIEVVNEGAIDHNLKVKGSEFGTEDLAGGESGELSVAGLQEGTYEIWCDIAGHADAGMRGTLSIGSGGSAALTGMHGGEGDTPDYAAMDKAMTDTMLAFPAETEGRGNQPLEPEIAADGTKVFDLTAEIIPWEIEPGVTVDAWAYNGQVPGPWIQVNTGDKVRFNLHNKLPMGTDIHWHGIQTPNDMDGVAPITQDLVEAGEDFTYEFVAQSPATGMYHAHHMGQMQVPNGMFGVMEIDELPLPLGQTISGKKIPEQLELAQEIPMVLNDAGAIGYSLNGKSFPATDPYVVKDGDWVQIHYYNEGLQIHPMHLHQSPQLVIAKDGIPLDNPYWADTINIAPGERYSVLVNFRDEGTWVWHCHILNHVEREEGMFGMVTAFVVEPKEA